MIRSFCGPGWAELISATQTRTLDRPREPIIRPDFDRTGGSAAPLLEDNLESKLDVTLFTRVSDLRTGRGIREGVGVDGSFQVGMVKGVECLHPKLDLHLLRDPEILVDAQIYVIRSRSVDHVESGIALIVRSYSSPRDA